MPVIVAPLLIGWAAVLALLLLWMLSQSGQTALAAIFGAIRAAVGHIWIVGSIINKGVDWLVHWSLQQINAIAARESAPLIGWFSHLAGMIERAAFSAYYTAVHTYDALYKLRHAIIPALIAAALAPVKILAHDGKRIGAAIWHRLLATAHAAERFAERAYRDALRAEHLAARALRRAEAGAIAIPWLWVPAQFGYTWKQIRAILRRLRSRPAELAAAALGAMAIAALSKIGAGWLKCANWRKIGRTGCRMPGHLLDDLLGLAVDFTVITNMCQVLSWLDDSFSDVGAPFVSLLGRAGAGVCRGGTPPHVLPFVVVPESLPGTVGVNLAGTTPVSVA